MSPKDIYFAHTQKETYKGCPKRWDLANGWAIYSRSVLNQRQYSWCLKNASTFNGKIISN